MTRDEEQRPEILLDELRFGLEVWNILAEIGEWPTAFAHETEWAWDEWGTEDLRAE